MGYLIEAVGHVRGGRDETTDDDWGSSRAVIELDPTWFEAEALSGLAEFSHAEIVFLFDRVEPEQIETGARHPRGNKAWPKVGIFAQRGRARPNRLGVSVVKIVSVDGLSLTVEGLDAVDGTPVVDIKPVLKGFLPRGEVTEPAWAGEIMKEYW
jgi:tRNA-Thr(GGU) m(6)t(6)A37 methyltransferase TsaA